MGWNWNVKVLATLITGAPYSRFAIVYIWSSQFFVASWADKLVAFSKTFFNFNVSALDMLN
jgi:hypothetical protein